MNYRPKHIAEYAALKFFQFCFNILPYRLALALGAGLGWLAFYVVRWRVANAKERIREVLGSDLPAREVNRIAFLSMRYMFFNMVDVLRYRFWTQARFRKYTDFQLASDRLHEFLKSGRGAVCATPHMGSWELGGRASEVFDVPLFFIVGVQRNPLFNQFINRLRGGTGEQALPRDDPMLLRKVMRKLKTGQVLAMTNDLRSRTKGIAVQFLGKEANMVGGMALFARQAKVPIFPMVVYRESWTQHRCILFDPIEPDFALSREDDWQRMTQLTMTMYENEIRKRPEQYFWYNKRWVLDPFIEEVPEPSPGQPAPSEQNAP
ncbi:lysophospholipid acyltransferase family protein [Pontiella agarivorans]|uniref:Lysophospholipid acyltransferase family protein n=1 Tax=Pontiella agarivorans TaxID=3038953 RepID=A0ABU5MSS1_9BACT|nr:lysophospholipid acyltransferase family protein [Pontiella agarivorans]MDZ8117182.1 lysophospholipid acyltransferase family protein [Pontiella agarivorans]